MCFVSGSRIIEIRIMPYPPNFKRMAARIMEPAIGASTCALGSHRWTPYNGILMRNASMHASHKMLFDQERSIELAVSNRIAKFNEPVKFWI